LHGVDAIGIAVLDRPLRMQANAVLINSALGLAEPRMRQRQWEKSGEGEA
jgi:hypothetical protein